MLCIRVAFLFVIAVGGLVACDDSASDIEKPSDGKADESARLCALLGEPSTCDPCDVAGWYGDGVCDDFCALPDTDCPAIGDVTTFLASTGLATSYAEQQVSAPTVNFHNRFVATTLPQSQADAWTQSGAAMVGDGYALQLMVSSIARIGSAHHYLMIRSSCPTLVPDWPEYPKAALDVVRWNAGTAERVACATGGSVYVGPRAGEAGVMRLAFNVSFSDGTTWVGKIFTAPLTTL